MVDTTLEQRGLRRHLVRMPVSVRWAKGDVGGTVLALVRDISERGVFLYLDARIPEGANIEFTLALPHEIVGDTSSIFTCKGRVVRLEEPLGGKSGVGARIDHYHKVPKVVVMRTQPSMKSIGSEPMGGTSRKMASLPEGAGKRSHEVQQSSASPYRSAEAAAPFLAVLALLVVGLLYAALSPAKTAVVVVSKPDPDAKVWVHTRSSQYYCPGSPEYEKAIPGKLMSQADAQLAYYRPAGEVCK